MILTQHGDGVRLHLGVGHLLVDGVALDVDGSVRGRHLERDVGHRSPASLLRLESSRVVSLQQ